MIIHDLAHYVIMFTRVLIETLVGGVSQNL